MSSMPTGIVHEGEEKFQIYKEDKKRLRQDQKAVTPLIPSRDPKWRYRWIVDYQKNNIPKDFPGWEETLNGWGYNMKNTSIIVAEMIAIGLGV